MNVENFGKILKKNEIDFFTGVPDSTFSLFMSYIDSLHGKEVVNIIASNECEAIANAIGYNLATSKIAVVYMQNSGEGKTVNPITSLAHKDVYSIPMLLLIGWRGEPGEKDEPQHVKMGKITTSLLELLDVDYEILNSEENSVEEQIERMKSLALFNQKPVALIVKKDIFESYKGKMGDTQDSLMKREEAIEFFLNKLSKKDVVVSTTGKASRELFELRVKRDEIAQDFYTVGGMGCASSIAHIVSLYQKNKKIFVIDGDGAAIMQLGSLATIGHYQSKNFYHIIIDNGVHESTGSQPTVSKTMDIKSIAISCGYEFVESVDSECKLKDKFENFYNSTGPSLLVVKTRPGSRKDLGRPTLTPIENKINFMEKLKND